MYSSSTVYSDSYYSDLEHTHPHIADNLVPQRRLYNCQTSAAALRLEKARQGTDAMTDVMLTEQV
jgi:hypothetical protein